MLTLANLVADRNPTVERLLGRLTAAVVGAASTASRPGCFALAATVAKPAADSITARQQVQRRNLPCAAILKGGQRLIERFNG